MLKYTLVILSFTCTAFSQNLRYDNVAYGPRGPIRDALIAVCSQPANTNTQPCTPLAPLCSTTTDTTCTSPHRLQADGHGTFTVQTYGPQVISPFVQRDQGTISETVAFLNGVYNAAACTTSAPSWCSGADIGGWINAAATACSGACIITIPAGTYSYSTTPTINKPGLSVVGAGVNATFLNYTGTGDAFRVQMNPFTVTQAGRLEGMTIQCTGACLGTTANGLHEGDVTGYRMIDLHIFDFTGATSACLWTDNNLGWTERGTEQSVWLDTCTILHKWTNTTNTQTTSSFGHWPLIDERWNLVGSETGWNVLGGLIYDDGYVSVTGNAQNNNTFFSVSGTQYSGGGATAVSAAVWSEQVESHSGTNTLFSISGSASLAGCGFFNTFGLTIGSSSSTNINGNFCPWFNGAALTILDTSGNGVPAIGVNSSNQTVIQGDATQQQVFIQPNPGSTLVQAAATTFGIQANKALVLGEGSSLGPNSGKDWMYGDSMVHCIKASYNNGSYVCLGQVVTASLVTTSGSSDNVTVTGMSSSGHCTLTPTNASGAANIATTYVSSKTTNQITVTHTGTANMDYDIVCVLQ